MRYKVCRKAFGVERRLADTAKLGGWVVCMRRKNGESDISLENIR